MKRTLTFDLTWVGEGYSVMVSAFCEMKILCTYTYLYQINIFYLWSVQSKLLVCINGFPNQSPAGGWWIVGGSSMSPGQPLTDSVYYLLCLCTSRKLFCHWNSLYSVQLISEECIPWKWKAEPWLNRIWICLPVVMHTSCPWERQCGAECDINIHVGAGEPGKPVAAVWWWGHQGAVTNQTAGINTFDQSEDRKRPIRRQDVR